MGTPRLLKFGKVCSSESIALDLGDYELMVGIELSRTAADAGARHRHEGCWGSRRGLPEPNSDLPGVGARGQTARVPLGLYHGARPAQCLRLS